MDDLHAVISIIQIKFPLWQDRNRVDIGDRSRSMHQADGMCAGSIEITRPGLLPGPRAVRSL